MQYYSYYYPPLEERDFSLRLNDLPKAEGVIFTFLVP